MNSKEENAELVCDCVDVLIRGNKPWPARSTRAKRFAVWKSVLFLGFNPEESFIQACLSRMEERARYLERSR